MRTNRHTSSKDKKVLSMMNGWWILPLAIGSVNTTSKIISLVTRAEERQCGDQWNKAH